MIREGGQGIGRTHELQVSEGHKRTPQHPSVAMRRLLAWYAIYQPLRAQLPDLPGRLRVVLGLWVEGTLRGLNGCKDTVTMALAHGLTGPGQSAHVATLAAGAAV